MKRLNNLLIKGTDFAQLDNGPARPNNDDIPGMRSGKFRGSPIGSAPQEFCTAGIWSSLEEVVNVRPQ
jgi:hypothetical protein